MKGKTPDVALGSKVAVTGPARERPIPVPFRHAQDRRECRVLGKIDIRWNLDHVGNAATHVLQYYLMLSCCTKGQYTACDQRPILKFYRV
jgi:hypothetical protein